MLRVVRRADGGIAGLPCAAAAAAAAAASVGARGLPRVSGE